LIQTLEIDEKAGEFGLGPADVEKDYVHGRVLHALYSGSPLGTELILKGGNCLRKAYLPNTRFSKDLDFSSVRSVDESFLKEELNRVCVVVEGETGISFDTSRTLVKDKGLPIPGVEAIEARLYFKGFYNEESITLKTQLDITQFDKIYLPIQTRGLIHPYSDVGVCSAQLRCQKIEEILASKLTTLLHRRKAVDMFDLLYSILIAQDYPVSRREVISTFLRKSVFDSEPSAAKGQLLAIPLEEFRTLWTGIIGPIRSLFNFDYVIANFYLLIENLFSLVLQTPVTPVSAAGGGGRLASLRPSVGLSRSPYLSRPYLSHDIRNTIINAGRSQSLLDLVYDGISRTVEPYKLEYRVRKSDNRGLEYFWAYDPFGSGRSKTPGIRQYICDKIQSVRSTGLRFSPRFEIEL
jgi:predicted nucleotidyltransferase component of viral defense system